MNDSKKSRFISVVDKETHDGVLRLDQKLKGLLVEIESRVEALSHESDETLREPQQAQLVILSEEVKKALVNIKQLVNLVVGENVAPETFEQLHQDDMDDFRQLVKDSLDKISELKDHF